MPRTNEAKIAATPEYAEANNQRPLYVSSTSRSFSNGIASPFIPYYARRINATSVELGWLQALSNLFPNLLQMPWGWLSDKVGRRVLFVIAGGAISSAIYFLIAHSFSPIQLIILVSIQAIAMSAMSPAWVALLGDLIPESSRGRILGSLTMVAGVASLLGTIVAAALLLQAPPTSILVYQFPFVVAGFSGIFAAFSLLSVKERKPNIDLANDSNSPPNSRKPDETRKDFLFFVKVGVLYNFFMSLIWPVMPITMIDVLRATNFDIAMVTILWSMSSIALQSQVGRLMDRVGPVPLVSASRFMLISVPIVYGIATNVYQIYVFSALIGIAIAMSNIAYTGYILEIAPTTKKGEYFAIYSTAIGVCTFAGSILGGYLTYYFKSFFTLYIALFAVYFISALGRAIGSFLFLKVKPPKKYPETLRDIMTRIETYFYLPWRH